VDLEKLASAAKAARSHSESVPVLVASGATLASLAALAEHADGVIVGSALRANGKAGGPIDERASATFAEAFRAAFAR
jgi:predicted TIM-barrel enzyme